MVITAFRKVGSGASSAFGWPALQRFKNVAFVTDAIMRLHSLPSSQKDNAKKQAMQIRDCVIQAQEYFVAGRAVGLATRPVLYYYGLVSLALAEILFKQSGLSNLAKTREQHARHGLDVIIPQKVPRAQPLDVAAAALRARPYIGAGGDRSGTFEVWHRSAREAPIIGPSKIDYGDYSHSTLACLATGPDKRMPLLPGAGITLYNCFEHIPGMAELLQEFRYAGSVVRGLQTMTTYPAQSRRIVKVVLHPAPGPTMHKVADKFLFAPGGIEALNIIAGGGGYVIHQTQSPDWPLSECSYPNAFQQTASEVWYCGNNQALNEFGLYYVALFILGNYARYFPDFWVRDVEDGSELAQASDLLLDVAAARLPILTYGELSQRYTVEIDLSVES